MRALKRSLAFLLLLLSAAGVLLCLAGIVATWRVIGPLTVDVDKAFRRVEDTLTLATGSLDAILVGLKKGKAELDDLKAKPTRTANDAMSFNALEKFIAQEMLKKISPQPGKIQQGLGDVHDASIVLQSLLGQVNELPVGVISSFDVEQLQGIDHQLTRVETKSQDLSSLLAQVAATPADEANAERVSRTAETVGQLIDEGGHYQVELNRLQAKVAEFKSRTLFWLRYGPLLLTLLLLWLALSQVSLLAHVWAWFQKLGKT